ncbi:DegT/DnrJ/EryC1/StrS family aminotransferase [Ectobacillus sp. sgz5001026]|uniref:DegT/DnrJ/EryC1/StrS family aminotransferase n=1 Tax=Ectobacillus sp. sgz5001026 TaxID=3242473 RepID=UPI0036D23178
MNKPVPVNEPLLNGNEINYLIESIKSGWISSEGPFVKQFEQKMAAYVGRKYAIAVCNGTAALELAVAALKLDQGSEIILPAFTIISCVAAIIRRGCVPVLVDSDPVTWNMDVRQIEMKITSKTKAIMVVHIYGLPVDMDPVLQLAEKYHLKVIEDASEAIGQTYKGRFCGNMGDISTFSFYANKHITTGEGGMVLTDSEELAEHCSFMRNLCFSPKNRFVHEELGHNFRMTNLQAAVGLAQLEQIDNIIQRKQTTGKHYMALLSNIGCFQLPLEFNSYADNIYWVYGIVLKDEVPFDANEMMRRLELKYVGTRPFFWPMHEQPIFRRMGLFSKESYPVAERLARRGFYIPSGLALTAEQRILVTNALKTIIGGEDIQ